MFFLSFCKKKKKIAHIESQTDIDKTSNSQPQLNESEYSNVAHSYYENGGYYDEHGGYYDEYGGYYDAEGNYYDTHGNFYDKESVAAYHGYNESHIENPTEIHEHTEPQITIDQSEQTKENEDVRKFFFIVFPFPSLYCNEILE